MGMLDIGDTDWYVAENPHGAGWILCIPRGLNSDNAMVIGGTSGGAITREKIQAALDSPRWDKCITRFCDLSDHVGINDSGEALAAVFCGWLIREICKHADSLS